MILRLHFLLLLLTAYFISPAQNSKVIEKDLVACFAKRTFDSANAQYADTACSNKLLYYTSKFPVTLTMDFQSLRAQDVNIMNSEDSLFRIYVWDTRPGTVGLHYKSIFQYSVGKETRSCLLPHPDTTLTGASLAFFDAIYTLNVNNTSYYLVTYINKYKPTVREEGIKVFSIAGGKLNDTVHLFKTKTGLHNELSYKYDVVASGDAASDYGIEYDTVKATIQIPVVLENGKMTSKHIAYKFTGQYFEKTEAKKD